MEAKDTPEDELVELYNKINTTLKHISSNQDKEAILILGPTGAGKSTLTYLLANKPLFAKINKRGDMVIESTEKLENVVISSKMQSETKIPSRIVTPHGLVIWDCPGFTDTDNKQEICNAFYLQKVFETTKFLKFILLLSDEDLKQGRGTTLINILKRFTKLFKSPESLQKNITLVISQGYRNKIQVQNTLTDVLDQNPNAPAVENLLRTLIQSIEVFPTPKEEGLVNGTPFMKNILSGVMNNSSFLETKPQSINVVLSEDAEALAFGLFEKTKEKLEIIVDQIIDLVERAKNPTSLRLQSMIDKFSQNPLYPNHNYVNSNYSLKEMIILETLREANNFCKDLLELQHENFFSFLINGIKHHILDPINQFYPKDTKIDVEEAQFRIIHIEFIEKVIVSNKNMFLEIVTIFKDVQKAFDDSIKVLTLNLQIMDKSIDVNYYQRLNHFLNFFPNEQHCQISSSVAFYHLCRINFEKKKYELALNNGVNSYLKNPNNRSALSIINQILIIDKNYIEKIEKKEILMELFSCVNQEIIKNLNDMKDKINNYCCCFIPISKNCEYLLNLEKIYSNLVAIGQVISDLHLSTLQQKIKNILELLIETPTDLTNKNLEIAQMLAKFEKKINFTQNLKIWVKILFDLQQPFGLVLFEKLKIINPNEFKCSEEKLQRIITLTSSEESINLNYWFYNPQICKIEELIKIRGEANSLFGNILFDKKEYSNASTYFIKAINENPNLINPFEKLAEIFFINGETYKEKINKEALVKINDFNTEEFKRIFKEYFWKTLENLKNNSNLFKFEGEDKDLVYLETLKKTFDLIETIYNKEDLNFLVEIQGIWEKFVDKKEVNLLFAKNSKLTMCEKYLKPKPGEEENSLKNSIVTLHFSYIIAIMGIKESKVFLKATLFNPKFDTYIGVSTENVGFFVKKVEKFDIKKNLKNVEYYQRIRDYFSIYATNNGPCAKNACIACLNLAKLTGSESLFFSALDMDNDFYNFCLNQGNLAFYNLNYYNENTSKREICNYLGVISMKSENYEGAWNYFKTSQNHLKMKVLFGKILEKDPENISMLEKMGDYYADIVLA